jgi:hypothetical protein
MMPNLPTEVYVFRHVDGANEGPGVDTTMGSNSGPCILLGHLPTDTIVDAALNKSATDIAQGRLGGPRGSTAGSNSPTRSWPPRPTPSAASSATPKPPRDYLANFPDWERP